MVGYLRLTTIRCDPCVPSVVCRYAYLGAGMWIDPDCDYWAPDQGSSFDNGGVVSLPYMYGI